jgi:5-methylcytosine-specific restriction protein A
VAHLCGYPGCPEVLDNPGRCKAHGNRRSTPGYGSGWKRVRDAYIREHPWCERCGEEAQEVHHKDGRSPLEPGANAWSNLAALCRPCHRWVTYHGDEPRPPGR